MTKEKGPEVLGEILSRLFAARGWGRRQWSDRGGWRRRVRLGEWQRQRRFGSRAE